MIRRNYRKKTILMKQFNKDISIVVPTYNEDESIGEKFRSWSFPEKLGMNFDMPDFEGVEINENEIELWRYTPGGSARLQHALKVSLNEDTRLITVSDFTGLLEIRKDIPDEGRILY